MRRRRDAAVAVAAVGIAAAITAQGVHAAFSHTTASTANTFAAGTVRIGDNDGTGSAMLTLSSATPGASDTSCIAVTYSGSLAARVSLYATVAGSLAPYLNLTVTRGTDPAPSFDSCTGFTADPTDYVGAGAGVVYSGTLGAYPASAATGLTDASAAAAETWTTGEVHVYRFVVTLAADQAAEGLSATADFHWEATNT